MNRLFILPLAALLTGCLPGQEPKQIIVDGRATIEVMPDAFQLNAGIVALESSQEVALTKVATIYAQLQSETQLLEGIESLELATDGVSTDVVHDQECAKEAYDEDACPIIGYKTSISISITGTPARLAGDMLSLTSELGATSVSFQGYKINDYAAAKEAALKAAVESARKKAEIMAAAAGATVVGATKIQIGSGFGTDGFEQSYDTIVVTGSRLRGPKISLDIEPQPIQVSAEVVAAFAIE